MNFRILILIILIILTKIVYGYINYDCLVINNHTEKIMMKCYNKTSNMSCICSKLISQNRIMFNCNINEMDKIDLICPLNSKYNTTYYCSSDCLNNNTIINIPYIINIISNYSYLKFYSISITIFVIIFSLLLFVILVIGYLGIFSDDKICYFD